jgi:hypothetical protein
MFSLDGGFRESFAPGSHSIRLLQGADLYSEYGGWRILGSFRSSKPGVNFSATGQVLGFAQKPAKLAKTGISLVTSLTIMTCWRREVNSNS